MKYDREQEINNLLSKNGNYNAYRKENYEYSERINNYKQYSFFNETKKISKDFGSKNKKNYNNRAFSTNNYKFSSNGGLKGFLNNNNYSNRYNNPYRF